MILKKIPKRSIIVYPGEFSDILSLALSHSLQEGDFINKFEDKFRQYLGVRQAITVSSGRFALSLILKNLGLKAQDKIILSAYNFSGVPKALLQEGYRPVFVDADPKTYQMDVHKIEAAIDNETKALLVTHIFGQPCDLAPVLDIAKKHKLFVIEDAAHSLGSYYRGRPAGTIADAGFFSFTGSKTINTSFGGAIVTDNVDLAGRIRGELSAYAFPKSGELIKQRLLTHIYACLNHRLFYSLLEYPVTLLMSLFNLDLLEIYKSLRHSDIAEQKMRFANLQALLGLRQLGGLDSLIVKRKKIASELIKRLDTLICLPQLPKDGEANYFMFPIRTKEKTKVFKKLLKKGVDSNLSYCCDCSYLVKGNLNPVAQLLSREIIALNLPFDLRENEVVHLSNTLNEISTWLN